MPVPRPLLRLQPFLTKCVGLDCAEGIELPIFGLRSLFRVKSDQWARMDLLRRAGIPIPRLYGVGDGVDGSVIVKLPGAKGGKGYFMARSGEEVIKGVEERVREGLIKSPRETIVQEYLIGVCRWFSGRAYCLRSSIMALGSLRRRGGAYRLASLGPSHSRG